MLWLTAVLCLGTCSVIAAQSLAAGQAADRFWPAGSAPASKQVAAAALPPSSSRDLPPETGSVIGRLEIPALELSVPVTTGVEPASLLHGVGHINGTAMPGGLGTLGLAGHRDTYLRALRNVAIGMDVRVVDASGVYHYTVDSTEIVTPEQVEVLNIQSHPELTLITCFPFNYVGPAPKRFIVHAHLNSVAPDAKD